jgi:hypothetical protein
VHARRPIHGGAGAHAVEVGTQVAERLAVLADPTPDEGVDHVEGRRMDLVYFSGQLYRNLATACWPAVKPVKMDIRLWEFGAS